MAEDRIVVFDARPYQLRREEPFAHIMAAVDRLRPDQDLLLINTFDPRPLEAVLASRGFRHEVRQLAADHWEVLFQRAGGGADEQPVLDNRGISPAQASVRTLQTLRRIPASDALVVLFDQDPQGFGQELERRGYGCAVAPEPDGSFRMTVRKQADGG